MIDEKIQVSKRILLGNTEASINVIIMFDLI